MEAKNVVGYTLLKIAAVYLMVGLSIGLFMGVSQSFGLISVHSHVGLLGWVTMAVTGLIYIAAPQCDGNWLSKVHFWLHNVGLPIMALSLVWIQYGGGGAAEAGAGVGSILVMIALLLFTLNLFLNGNQARMRMAETQAEPAGRPEETARI